MNLPAMKLGDAFNWDDLLRRPPTFRTSFLSKHSSGKRVLITGAGGSIGSALAHCISASNPADLVLLDTSENSLYQIDRSLREAGCDQHVSILGSVCDSASLVQLFKNYRPQIVFHAAALKHVPLLERNPLAAITNNAVGSLSLAKTAAAFHAEHLVLVSTDKAVDPLSIMGASKRIAELALLAIGATTDTRMVAVRLGNVAYSQGSVIPLFLDQIARGVPITVTHRDAQRYFITIDRTVEALCTSLEFKSCSTILIPDLGAPIRILDLAHHLLSIHGSSAPIRFIGLRPGDKITESLLSSRERWITPSAGGGLREVASTAPALAFLDAAIHELSAAALRYDLTRMLHTVATLVPEYQPSAIITAALDQISGGGQDVAQETLA